MIRDGIFRPFHVVADGRFEELQLYYTTSFAKRQGGNDGNERGNVQEWTLTVGQSAGNPQNTHHPPATEKAAVSSRTKAESSCLTFRESVLYFLSRNNFSS